MLENPTTLRRTALAVFLGIVMAGTGFAQAGAKTGSKKTKSDFPPFAKATEGYKKVVSTADGKKSLFDVWVREKDGQVLAELPADFAKHRYFIALTVSSGERFAGLQAGDMYVYWRRYDKRIALVEPNLVTRSTGDDESKSSVKRLFTDRVLLDVPISSIRKNHGPLVDLDAVFVGHAAKFFGRTVNGLNRRLVSLKKAKAFPDNVELAWEVPVADGRLKILHFSISRIPDDTGYKPRIADPRVGYFTTAYQDLGRYDDDQSWVRYINRWHLEKADPSLKFSPAKQPIIFYVEHTTPIRYRRFVRDGILTWNDAFERVGILDAVQVHYQDARSGAHMDKDPEDVRYNFVRWLNNDVGTAIGPSRVHPLTGQILDADIILTDGWIRAFQYQFSKLLPATAMEGMSPDTLAWLEGHPSWDPRLRFASPHERRTILAQRARREVEPLGGHPAGNVDPHLLGDDEFDGLAHRTCQTNGLCLAATGKALDLAQLRLAWISGLITEKKDAKNAELIDGMPAEFIGPLLADLVAHEVGHTLGLRHNFKASHLYTMAEINSAKVKGKPFTGSVMDYNPININMGEGKVQGDYAMSGVGPYDLWAIEYGYSFDKDLKPILAQCTKPENQYLTDEDTSGPDPFARRYDFSKNPLEYAENQMKLARHHREHLLEKFVQNGESWAKARRGYDLTLNLQTRAVSMMANWIGGVFNRRDMKGDAGNRSPIEVVSRERQLAALDFIVKNSFRDDAYGLSSRLLRHFTLDKWWDGGGENTVMQDVTYPVHDRVMGLQASVLTMLMNPSTLRRVLDNEARMEDGKSGLGLPELLERVGREVWSEIAAAGNGAPKISSLRRNLQREHVERLIDLSMAKSGPTAMRTIASLATSQLTDIRDSLKGLGDRNVDAYTRAHVRDLSTRIERALDARYVLTKVVSTTSPDRLVALMCNMRVRPARRCRSTWRRKSQRRKSGERKSVANVVDKRFEQKRVCVGPQRGSVQLGPQPDSSSRRHASSTPFVGS